jgi:hypothetical protein
MVPPAQRTSIRMFRPSIHPRDCRAFSECRNPCLTFRFVFGNTHQLADSPHPLGLLRARCQWPRCRAAYQCNEITPSHSITSSARASSEGGTSRARALAVLKLMRSSNVAGLFYWQYRWICALEDFVDIDGGAPEEVYIVRSITHEATASNEKSDLINGW